MNCRICGKPLFDWERSPSLCELCLSNLADCQDHDAKRLIERLANRINELESRLSVPKGG